MDHPSGTLGGMPVAADIFPQVYTELRAIAAARMANEAAGHSLDATALVHEAYLRLADQPRFVDRTHFLRAAATAMRHILVDHARARTADKRGGGRVRVTLNAAAWSDSPDQLLALNDALERFAAEEPQKAELVTLRFFGGLSTPDAARALGVSVATAERWWSYARAWLYADLSDEFA